MSENEECESLQSEEAEVLASIYEGDDSFSSEPEKKIYRYKYGQDGESRSFVLTITWLPNYPMEVIPEVSMDTFYNEHIVAKVKEKIIEAVKKEAEQYLGMSMTYSLFEFMKEHLEEFMSDQPVDIQEARVMGRVEKLEIEEKLSAKVEKKEQLTKAQKRRMWDKGGMDSEDRPRGWNWVDVIRHLSQTGAKE